MEETRDSRAQHASLFPFRSYFEASQDSFVTKESRGSMARIALKAVLQDVASGFVGELDMAEIVHLPADWVRTL